MSTLNISGSTLRSIPELTYVFEGHTGTLTSPAILRKTCAARPSERALRNTAKSRPRHPVSRQAVPLRPHTSTHIPNSPCLPCHVGVSVFRPWAPDLRSANPRRSPILGGIRECRGKTWRTWRAAVYRRPLHLKCYLRLPRKSEPSYGR